MSIARIAFGIAAAAAAGYVGYKLFSSSEEKKSAPTTSENKTEKKDVELPSSESARKFEQTANPTFDKFIELYEKLEKSGAKIGYKSEWANGTGYFNGIFNEALIPGFQCFEDEHGRKAIVHADHVRGNVVVFQRYSEGNTLSSCAPFSTGFKGQPGMEDLERFAKNQYEV